jgi:hypothetical protein
METKEEIRNIIQRYLSSEEYIRNMRKQIKDQVDRKKEFVDTLTSLYMAHDSDNTIIHELTVKNHKVTNDIIRLRGLMDSKVVLHKQYSDQITNHMKSMEINELSFKRR